MCFDTITTHTGTHLHAHSQPNMGVMVYMYDEYIGECVPQTNASMLVEHDAARVSANHAKSDLTARTDINSIAQNYKFFNIYK